jgi:predicted CopG family antitoxin
MKTINLSDEDYNFLVEAKKLLLTQDNRCTRDPIYYVKYKTKIYGIDSDYADGYDWRETNHSTITVPEELFDSVFENDSFQEIVSLYNEQMGNDIEFNCLAEEPFGSKENEEKVRKWFNDESSEDYSELCELLDSLYNIQKVFYIFEDKVYNDANIFSLFEIDAVEYAKSKNHDGVDPGNVWSYADSTWRASRMNKLRDIIQRMDI